ncbi:C40 family peptidase [Aneurinibacillus terranovensis]|uniref:C40 family peptidase n=1 Tax=Aneurinibacillus terranovensis TaxID=278991 RepID=UPI000410E654|nr:NlpC/P60 family protein [Aneurinibacillus terranovensis]
MEVIDNVIRTGMSLIGKSKFSYDYRPPAYLDCSSFIYYIFKENGINIGTKAVNYQVFLGEYVSMRELRKGDLVFFNTKKEQQDATHVALYLGNGRVLHMTNPRYNVIVSRLDSWLMQYYMTARRII